MARDLIIGFITTSEEQNENKFSFCPSAVVTTGLIPFIKLYKIGVSPVVHWLSFSFFGSISGCRSYPTCSEYAIQVFSDNSFTKASFLVLKRLSQCHSFHHITHNT